jgi:high-affinity iron transporter
VSGATTPLGSIIEFASSVAIIIREGLETLIILRAILTCLVDPRNKKFKKYVYFGSTLAIGATLTIWFALDYTLKFFYFNKDLIKGIIIISAVVVLFWVNF